MNIDTAKLVGNVDIVFITLDTLRYDVACSALSAGRTPNLANVLPNGNWERRHSSGSFTYAAHQAFFAGFLPTPDFPGPHDRLFAARFPGSETTSRKTCVFETADIVTGLAGRGYRTICVGGVGFFNKLTPLGEVLPSLFHQSYWSPQLGVTAANSTENQVKVALESINNVDQRIFLFINVSALHQPNCMYVEGATSDSIETQTAALEYVDSKLPPLFDRMRLRGQTLYIICSDHGTAYGEDGFVGHRLAHPVVWNVPYAQFIL